MKHHASFTEKVSFSTVKNDCRSLWNLVKGKRHVILIIVALMALIRSIDSVANYLFKIIVDAGVIAIDAGSWTRELIFWGALFALILFLNKTVFSYIKEVISQIILVKLENKYPVIAHKKYMALSVAYHSQHNTGEKISRTEKGYQNLNQALGDLFKMILPQLIFLLVNLGIIAYISWQANDWLLAVLFFIPFIPAAWLNYWIYAKFSPVWNKIEEKKEERSGIFGQSVYHIKAVKQGAQSNVANLKIKALSREITDINVAIIKRIQFYYSLISGIFYFFLLLTCAYALGRAMDQRFTIGTVVFIYMTGNTMFHTLWMMIYVFIRFMQNMAAVRRVEQVLEAKPEIKNHPRAVRSGHFSDRIRFIDVDFSYQPENKADESSQLLFHRLNMEIEAGKKTAIVGISGAGKTSLFNLISRFYDVKAGMITYDGVDIRQLDIDSYNHLFATVYQEPAIFNTTIKENVCFSCQVISPAGGIFIKAADAEVEDALRVAGLAELLELPKGIYTEVSEGGRSLSGGQKQRLELARAIFTLKNGAEILLLDEPTANLDAQTERIVQDSLNQLRREIEFTTIIVSHRLASIRDADKIIVIKDGRVAEQGSHEELMSRQWEE